MSLLPGFGRTKKGPHSDTLWHPKYEVGLVKSGQRIIARW